MKSNYIKLLFLGIVFFLFAISILTYRNLNNYIKEVHSIRHSAEVLETLEVVLSTIKDAENGHFGYQLTRDSTFLPPYYASVKALPRVLKSLDSLVIDNDIQTKRVDTLTQLVNDHFLIINQILTNARQSELYMDRFESDLIRNARDNMNEIRAIGKRLRLNEEALFKERITSESGLRNIAPISLLFYGLASLAGIAFLFSRVLDELEKRKNAEDSLKENVQALRKEVGIREFTQKTLRNVLDNSLDGIMAFRAVRNASNEIVDFEWILANAVSFISTRQSEKHLVGKRLLQLMPETMHDGLFEMYKEVVESAAPRQVERHFDNDGLNNWFSITAVKLEDGFVVTFSDITGQKMQRLLIEEREVLLKDAEQVANMGSWKWSEKNDEIIWSDGLFKIFGKIRQQYVPSWKSFLENVHADDKPAMENFLRELRVKRNGIRMDYRIELGDRIRYLSMNSRPIEGTASPFPEVLGTVIDITERKLYENQLKQYTSELKRSNEDLEQFAYVASHDLQEPLRKIRAFGDLASKHLVNTNGSKSDYIIRMQSAAARMQVLIEDLLLFSRVSRSSNAFEPLAIKPLLEEVVDDLNEQVKRESAMVRFGGIPDIQGDRTQMKRLFQNLISNAIKFHKPGQAPVVDISGRIMRYTEIMDELHIAVSHREYARINVKD
ncbi:MAG TPA: CHASE3 domain-containing protein, partial [Chryseolinea sp.]|nr:CHASE3 domain-containing protein [Chryseolinea sp.]